MVIISALTENLKADGDLVRNTSKDVVNSALLRMRINLRRDLKEIRNIDW